ncbi:MAG: aminotransferase class IV [Gemmatimonadota bacterium]|nr:MAG: aminotransferase class IV [Gemmatimonadota bacterium]
MSKPEMVYLNGELVAHEYAKISVEDRGFNFADGIYEVVRVVGGNLFRVEAHLDRLERGARALQMELPLARQAFRDALHGVARANGTEEGTIYVQLTRGVAPRKHSFPEGARPTLVMLARPFRGATEEYQRDGVSVLTAPDLRWGYCEVKTIGLLPNVMAYQKARSEGGFEAIMVREGKVTEGAHSSAFCVIGGTVYTHPIENILPSITRRFTIEALRGEGVDVREEKVALDAFRTADEVFLVGTTTEVMPVVRMDGKAVSNGKPGDLTRLALQLYLRDLEAARGGAAG